MSGYVTVPLAPGVPPVLRNPALPTPVEPVLLIADDLSILANSVGPQWGIFDDDGAPVITGDSCRSFEFKADAHISTYPVEEGGFASYNKVARPQEVRFTFLISQSTENRAEFLDTTLGVLPSLDLYSAVSPEASYDSVNVTHVEYKRDRESAKLIAVEVWLEEIRQTGTATFSNTAQPQSANPVNGGTVSAQPYTPTGTSPYGSAH